MRGCSVIKLMQLESMWCNEECGVIKESILETKKWFGV